MFPPLEYANKDGLLVLLDVSIGGEYLVDLDTESPCETKVVGEGRGE